MKYPWIAWYPAEYISKTRSLTMKQHGAYCLLLWEYYTNGPLANASGLLNVCCSKTEEDRADVAMILENFFFLEDGFWHHKRADEEIKKRGHISKQRHLAGRQGGLAKATRLLEQKATQSQSHKTIEPIRGEALYSSEEKSPPLSKTNGKYTQTDYDERDIRKLSEAEHEILQKLSAQVGSGDPITEEEFFTAACEMAGITVQRGLKLKQLQRKWPERKD